ncbi:MAG: hypothetical protein IPK12_23565 [Gemmatimonadetes bacterium]|nr:hypothetical protein [Gemmatimonadota bacterium]
MTAPIPNPIFRKHPDGPQTALVTLTVTGAVVFTDGRCPDCRRIVLLVPGAVLLSVTRLPENSPRRASGRGPIACCKRCGHWLEVVEHR